MPKCSITGGVWGEGLLFLDKILRSVDDGHCADIIFLDLAKAFDKVPHQRLLEKLRNMELEVNYYALLGIG